MHDFLKPYGPALFPTSAVLLVAGLQIFIILETRWLWATWLLTGLATAVFIIALAIFSFGFVRARRDDQQKGGLV